MFIYVTLGFTLFIVVGLILGFVVYAQFSMREQKGKGIIAFVLCMGLAAYGGIFHWYLLAPALNWLFGRK